jgi:hypothetical protein
VRDYETAAVGIKVVKQRPPPVDQRSPHRHRFVRIATPERTAGAFYRPNGSA